LKLNEQVDKGKGKGKEVAVHDNREALRDGLNTGRDFIREAASSAKNLTTLKKVDQHRHYTHHVLGFSHPIPQ